MTAVTYRVLVDWNNDGDYADTYETQQVFNADGISISAGRDQPRQYSPVRVGEAAWIADNRDNRFSGTAGLLGTNLKPFRKVKVQAKYGTPTYTLISDFEGVYGNSTDHVRTGSKSAYLNLPASSTTGWDCTDTLANYSAIAGTERWACWVYVQEAANVDTLKVKFRKGPLDPDMFIYSIAGSTLVNGWNRITGLKSTPSSVAGSPSWGSIGRVDVELNTGALGPAYTWWDFLAWGSGGDLPETYVDLFTGTVDRWGVKVDNYPLITADFQALDALGRLAAAKIYTPLYSGITTDVAAGYVLDAAGFTGDRNLSPGYSVLGYWWVDGETALDALQKLATHEGGLVYVDGTGALVLENRYTRYAVTTDVDTFSSVHALELRSSVRDVVNRVSVTTAPRSVAAGLSDVWTYTGALTLAPGEARKITAHGSDPFSGAVVPVSGTDFTVTIGSVASVSALDRTSGQTTGFTITAGSDGATLTGLKLRANTVTATVTATWIAEDTASQTAYGLRTLELDMPYLADANVGRDAAYYYLARYSAPVDALDVTIKAATADGTSATIQRVLNRGLGQRVRVTISALGLDWSGFIEAVKHRIRGERHEATYSIERLRDQRVFTLDVDFLDSDATLGW